MRILHALCFALMAAPAFADVDLSRLDVEPNPRLGLAFPGSQVRYYSAIADAGIGVVRLSVSWDLVEPAEGRFDFRGMDERVRALQDLGIQPFLTFESNADWATDPETRKVKNARPADPALWRRFVGAVVARYDGDGAGDMQGLRFPVRYYQVANEWIGDNNRSGGWAGTPQQLIDYVNIAHDAVKAEDPDAIFVMGGIASFNADIFVVQQGVRDLDVRQSWSPTSETVMSRAQMRGPEIGRIINEEVLPVLRNSRYDVASVHLYGPETRDIDRITLLRRVTGHPVLSTECGGPTLDYGGDYSAEGHFRAVIHRNLNVLSTGSAFCLWFRLGEAEGATFGNRKTALYDGSARPKPGVFAYRLLSRLIDSKATVTRESDERFTIRRGDGVEVAVAWGGAAAALRGDESLCLSDPERGLLTSDPDGCEAGAITVSGKGLFAILSI